MALEQLGYVLEHVLMHISISLYLIDIFNYSILCIVCILHCVGWPHLSTNQRAAFQLSEPPAEIVVSTLLPFFCTSTSRRRLVLLFLYLLALLVQACKQFL